MLYLLSIILIIILFGCDNSSDTPPDPVDPQKSECVDMQTNFGKITIELNRDKAPVSVKNFLTYVNEKFYDGTLFHRVVTVDFPLIQGGGFTTSYTQKSTHDPIINESDNGLSNVRGTIGMARLPAPDTATSEFYINVADNTMFDYTGPTFVGYAVFGKVRAGMDVVDTINDVPTGAAGPFTADTPLNQVVIESAKTAECM